MLLTNEPATVTNEKDACSLFKTVNTKNEEDIPPGRLIILLVCLFWLFEFKLYVNQNFI